MFLTISFFRARDGEDDAVIALHEAWDRELRNRAHGYLSGELLRNPNDAREFVRISRFASEEDCRKATEEPDEFAWHERLDSLLALQPLVVECVSEWQAWQIVAGHWGHPAQEPDTFVQHSLH